MKTAEAIPELSIIMPSGERISYSPGDPAFLPALCGAERELTTDLGDLMAIRQTVRDAIRDAAPDGAKLADYSISVDINLSQGSAKELALHGFRDLVSMTESTNYRLLKREFAKLAKLDPDKAAAALALLSGCTRSVKVMSAGEKEAE
jgi:hypothetical protein